jgi:quinol monooxygenase YgiN
MADSMTATIDPRTGHLTLVNVYEVEPAVQAELVKALTDATESTIRHQPGFVSVSIHSSLDGRRVVNYAQWASKEHFDRFLNQPGTRAQLERFAQLASSVAPGLYRVNVVIAAEKNGR